MKGEIDLRPYLTLTEAEREKGKVHERQVTVQCLGPESYSTVMLNKLWPVERFQAVVDGIRKLEGGNVNVVQIGGGDDPQLDGVTDLRGKTTLRESAAILDRSLCFVGTVGLGMHLARSVDCRAVIVYGGREHSWQSGYSCNENIDSMVDCAPCWKWSDCDYERKCMTMISPESVIDAVRRVLHRNGGPLAIDTATL